MAVEIKEDVTLDHMLQCVMVVGGLQPILYPYLQIWFTTNICKFNF